VSNQPPPGYGPPPGQPDYGQPLRQPEPGSPGYGPPSPPPYGQQPPYGQPGYGQPGQYEQSAPYGQQPMGPVTTQFARLDPGPSQSFGLIGALVALIGAAALIVSFTAVNWFSFPGTNGDSHFGDVHTVLNAADSSGLAAEPANAYFSWLAWVLLIVAVLVALLAVTPAIGTAFRVIGPIVALGAIVLTFLAVKLFSGSNSDTGFNGYGDYLKHTSIGFYLALAGFLLAGIGAVVGPRNSR
jgi:hypothetical protein